MIDFAFPEVFRDGMDNKEMLLMLNNWELVENEKGASLNKLFVFSDFLACMAFMSEVSPIIEQLGHHPDWSNSYSRLFVKCTTWDNGNSVSVLDFKLAYILDQYFFFESQRKSLV